MGTTGPIIADAASMGPRYAKRLLVDVAPDRFARLAAPGGKEITVNHPAFVLGHLCLYPVKVLELLQLDTAPAQPPAAYEKVFSKTATCTDDPAGEIYPKAEEIISFFESSYSVAIAAMRDASDELLATEHPDDIPMKQICKTRGAVLAFYLTGHVMTHLGQLSSWRRMEGLPPA